MRLMLRPRSPEHSLMSQQLIPASRKRVLLALYLDYVVLSPVLALGLDLSTGQFEVPTWQELIVLSIYEAILYHVTDSPGFRLLSIRKAPRSMVDDSQVPIAGGTLLVDPNIYLHEHWQTILIGLLFVAEGAKQLVRWAMWTPPLPLFGIATNQTTFAAYSMVLGSLLILTGYMFLQVKRAAFWLGTTLAALMATSTVMAWNQWDGIARELLFRRRSFQGLPVLSGEVEFLQAILPEALVAFLVVTILVMFLVRNKLQS